MIREATPAEIFHVVNHMRADDLEENGLETVRQRMEFAAALLEGQALAIKNYCFFDRAGEPATLLGAYLVGPRRAAVHRLSTERWSEVSRAVLRFGLTVFVPKVLKPNVDTAQCRVMGKHRAALYMLERLGFEAVGIAGGFVELEWHNPGSDD